MNGTVKDYQAQIQASQDCTQEVCTTLKQSFFLDFWTSLILDLIANSD